MGNFNPDNYAPVQDRIAEFFGDFPTGSIRTRIARIEGPDVIFEARVFRSPEDVERNVYTSGFAREKEGVGMVNKTSHVENCECVPLTVPALTREGWRFFHQLMPGTEVLAFDVASGHLVWDRIQKVSVFPDQSLVRIGNTRFHADCTPNHRWVMDGALRGWDERPRRATAKIRVAARFAPTETRTEDAARLGWLFGDCVITYASGLASRAEITQSKTENFGSLVHLFGQPRVKAGGGTERKWADGGVSVCREAMCWSVPAGEVRRVLGVFGVNTESDLPRAVLGMNSEEADAFLDSMLRSDGSRGIYAKTSRELCVAVQLAMFVTGHATGPVGERTGNQMTTRPCFTVSMHRRGEKHLSEFTEILLPPQDVWCPTTRTGTWIGLFSGRPAITGNTSAVGRALANMNYPGAIDGRAAPRPSREEMHKVHQAAPRGGERFVPEATVKYINAHAPGVGKSAQITVGEDTYNFREYVQANWRAIVSTSSVAEAVAKVVEKETGVTFKPEAGG